MLRLVTVPSENLNETQNDVLRVYQLLIYGKLVKLETSSDSLLQAIVNRGVIFAHDKQNKTLSKDKKTKNQLTTILSAIDSAYTINTNGRFSITKKKY